MVPMAHTISAQLAARREALGMTIPALAARSGVSEPTIKRILSGQAGRVALDAVAAVAQALGLPLGLDPIDIETLREREARRKAERIARMVQGTSALESQAVDDATYRALVERSYHELLAGSKRRLWSV